MIACGVPVAALVTLLGGVDFGEIVGLFVVSVSLAVVGCVLSLTISVWAAKTHDVLMAVYMILALWLMALPIWGGLSASGKLVAPPRGSRRPIRTFWSCPTSIPERSVCGTMHSSPGLCC